MSQKRPTMKDVATEAGVSRATVSLVMRRSPQIPEVTAERVHAAMRRLGYVYNRVAGKLRGGGPQSFGVLLTNARNPYLTEMIMAMEADLEGTDDMILTAFSLGGRDREAHLAHKLAGQGVSGLVMLPFAEYTDEDVDQLAQQLPVPIVLLAQSAITAHDHVSIDDYLGGRLIGEHLREIGVRDVHFIGGYDDRINVSRRIAGIRDTVVDGTVTAHLEPQRTYDFQALAEVTESLLSASRPEAIVTFNDAQALGVYTVLRRMGIEPGRDIAFASFDDVPLSSVLSVPLTSVRTRPDQMGKEALRLLRRRIADPSIEPGHFLITPEIVIRESTSTWR